LEGAVITAQKKFEETKNKIELTDAQTALKNYRDELTVTLAKPINDWIATVESVDAGRKGAYVVRLQFVLTDSTEGHIGFLGETHDEAIIATLKGLQKGDIVKFSGKRESARRMHSLYVADFVLSAISAVKK
jgi:hypothetical protein